MNNIEIITCNNNSIGINSYILKCNNHIIVIDPNNYDELISIINEKKVDYILLTHEHFDHIMAVDKLREKYNAKVIAQKFASENIQSSSKNLSRYSNIILDFMNKSITSLIEEFSIKPADILFEETYELLWEGNRLFFKHTPGHSEGSCCIYTDNYLFSGDSLFEIFEPSLKGFGASKNIYNSKTIPFFKSLDKSMQVFAGHYNSFILEDKLYAKEKAIQIFITRCKYTNCYANYNDFINLIENCYFFVRKNCIFIITDLSSFYRFYYFINDFKELTLLNDFFDYYKKPIILEIVSKNNINEKLYEQSGFSFYKTFSRYSTKKSGKKYNVIKVAENDDINEIKELIDNSFNPLIDYIPTIADLEIFVKNEEMYVVKIEEIIAGVSIYQKNCDNYYFRLSCVHPKYRPGFIGYMLAASSPNKNGRCIAWVDDDNIEAKKLNASLGYEKDGLKNNILIRKINS